MIIDVIDCLLCNAGCCNIMKHVTRVLLAILVCVDADSNIQLYLMVLSCN